MATTILSQRELGELLAHHWQLKSFRKHEGTMEAHLYDPDGEEHIIAIEDPVKASVTPIQANTSPEAAQAAEQAKEAASPDAA